MRRADSLAPAGSELLSVIDASLLKRIGLLGGGTSSSSTAVIIPIVLCAPSFGNSTACRSGRYHAATGQFLQ